MTIDDYIVLADIPKIQVESEKEFPGLRLRNQSPSPCRDQRLRTYRLVMWHCLTASFEHLHLFKHLTGPYLNANRNVVGHRNIQLIQD